jgi:hypothetical protein
MPMGRTSLTVYDPDISTAPYNPFVKLVLNKLMLYSQPES